MPHRANGPISLRTFSLGDMLRCGVEIRRVSAGCASMEAAARAVVRFLHATFRDEGDRPSCVLLRCFVTLPYRDLPAELQEAARGAHGVPLADGTRCLVLLDTAGEAPEWNDRRASREHRVIPLPGPEVVEQAPMIARMMGQMGVDLGTLLGAGEGARPGAAAKTYDVFYVPEADGSEHIPAQEAFVRPYGVRSVVGFGGVLQEEFFVFILFSREPIPADAATRFRNIALDARLALLRHERRRVFEPGEHGGATLPPAAGTPA